MRKLLTFLIATIFSISVSASSFGGMMTTGVGSAPHVSPSYTGPGDVQPGAVSWYGLRAYSAAYAAATGNAIDITDQASANPLTVKVLTSGDLDVASINAWVTAHSVTSIIVVKLYDQTGNGFHLATTNHTFPLLNLSPGGLGAGRPALAFTVAALSAIFNSSTAVTNTPWSLSIAYNHTVSGITDFWGDTSGNGLASLGANTITVNLGVSATATDNVWHAVQGIDQGSGNAVIRVDGTTTSAGGGTSANLTATTQISAAFNSMDGFIVEAGRWGGDKSATNATLTANQKAYWGF